MIRLTTPISEAQARDLKVGDEIYGTVREGVYRRYRKTRVLDIWSDFKPAYRTVLEDGTELITSGVHRFLSNRGWKYVTGAEQGPLQRSHLTRNNKLMGTGRGGEAPIHTGDYRRGYLCGLIRGDGHIGSYTYPRRNGQPCEYHRFRLALTDLEALQRARSFLSDAGAETDEFVFADTAGYKPVSAIRTQARDKVALIRELIEWPRRATTTLSKAGCAPSPSSSSAFWSSSPSCPWPMRGSASASGESRRHTERVRL